MKKESSDDVSRREFVMSSALAAAFVTASPHALLAQQNMKSKHGLFGSLRAKPGDGEKLAKILTNDIGSMPGCILYVVGRDPKDVDLIYVMEVWETKEDHANSLKIPAVREAITKAMPLVAEMPKGGTTLEIVGGKGV